MTSMFSEINPILSIVFCLCIFFALRTTKEIYLLLAVSISLLIKYFGLNSYNLELILFLFSFFYLIYLMIINYKTMKKFYENNNITFVLQLLSLLLLTLIQIDINFLILLVFGYFMLFRQARWHKHLYIMFLMIFIIFVTTGGIEQIYKLLEILK